MEYYNNNPQNQQNPQIYNPNLQDYNNEAEYMGVYQSPQPIQIQQGIPLNYQPYQENNQFSNAQIIAKPHLGKPVGMNQNTLMNQNQIYPNQKTSTHSHFPADICCTNCRQNIQTSIEYEIGLGTWTMVLLFLCCFWPLTCLPCCLNSMKDVVHYCPQCGAFCGRKKFLC